MVLYNMYGMSETTAQSLGMKPSKFSITTAGYPLDGMELKIQNPDSKGEGEITMRGRHIMMGYLKNEKATIETLDD